MLNDNNTAHVYSYVVESLEKVKEILYTDELDGDTALVLLGINNQLTRAIKILEP